jgi:hypothetical protein
MEDPPRSELYVNAIHVESYPLFAAQVEAIIQCDVDTYVSTVAERKANSRLEDE